MTDDETEPRATAGLVRDLRRSVPHVPFVVGRIGDLASRYFQGQAIEDGMRELARAGGTRPLLFLASLASVERDSIFDELRDVPELAALRANWPQAFGLLEVPIRRALNEVMKQYLNRWTEIRSEPEHNMARGTVRIRFDLFDGEKLVYQTRDDLGSLARLGSALLRRVGMAANIALEQGIILEASDLLSARSAIKQLENTQYTTAAVIEGLRRLADQSNHELGDTNRPVDPASAETPPSSTERKSD